MHAQERVALPYPRGTYVYCGPIRLQNHGHMTLVECNYAWSVRTRVRSVCAHGTEVAVSFYCTHTWVANYCITTGCVSATLLTRPFLARAWRGLGTRLAIKWYLRWCMNTKFISLPVEIINSINNYYKIQLILLGNGWDGEVRVHIVSDYRWGFDVDRGGQHGRVYCRFLPLPKPHKVKGRQVDQSRQHGVEVKCQRVLG